jgi:HK97 family phage prohead protease
MERKLLSFDAVELKFSRNGSFAGYASAFHGVDSVGDMVLPGAYSETLKNRQRGVKMFYNHSPVWPIGKWSRIEEDGKGLFVQGQLTPGHSVAEDVKAALAHGTVDGLSIGYRIPSGGSEKDGKIRKLKRVDLIEISVVTNPADPNARIDPESIKSAIDALDSIQDLEDFLRDAGGLSRTGAKSLIAQARTLLVRDARREETEAAAVKGILAVQWPKSLFAG